MHGETVKSEIYPFHSPCRYDDVSIVR